MEKELELQAEKSAGNGAEALSELLERESRRYGRLLCEEDEVKLR